MGFGFQIRDQLEQKVSNKTAITTTMEPLDFLVGAATTTEAAVAVATRVVVRKLYGHSRSSTLTEWFLVLDESRV